MNKTYIVGLSVNGSEATR